MGGQGQNSRSRRFRRETGDVVQEARREATITNLLLQEKGEIKMEQEPFD